MKKVTPDYDSLVLFVNRTFTQKQWSIILNGCNCPKSATFWQTFRTNCLVQYQRNSYTLETFDKDIFESVLSQYRAYSVKAVQKTNRKKKVRAQIEHKTITLYQNSDGSLTTERPERD